MKVTPHERLDKENPLRACYGTAQEDAARIRGLCGHFAPVCIGGMGVKGLRNATAGMGRRSGL